MLNSNKSTAVAKYTLKSIQATVVSMYMLNSN